jgi:cell division septation protein DedD
MNEIYEFSFERGQLIKVAGGVLSLVVLVFCAGFVAGLALQFREPTPTLVAQSTQPKAKPVAVAAPSAPALVTPPVEQVVANKEEEPAIDPDQPAVEETAENDDKPAARESDEPVQSGIPGRFAVQLGAFLRPENAEVLSRKLASKGYDADVVVREDSHGRMWYLVRYGIFPNRAEASAVALEFRSHENLEALVRPSNSM